MIEDREKLVEIVPSRHSQGLGEPESVEGRFFDRHGDVRRAALEPTEEVVELAGEEGAFAVVGGGGGHCLAEEEHFVGEGEEEELEGGVVFLTAAAVAPLRGWVAVGDAFGGCFGDGVVGGGGVGYVLGVGCVAGVAVCEVYGSEDREFGSEEFGAAHDFFQGEDVELAC